MTTIHKILGELLESHLVVDARMHGNLARFFNHRWGRPLGAVGVGAWLVG